MSNDLPAAALNPDITELVVDGRTYLLSGLYADKHGLPDKRIAPACRKSALLGIRRMVVRPGKKLKAIAWFILDIPPADHPGWPDYYDRVRKAGKYAKKQPTLKDRAGEYLKRFDEARVLISETKFGLNELARMLGTHKSLIMQWVEIGEPGYGRLPRMKLAGDKLARGGGDAYFNTTDVRLFLLGELNDPRKKFHSIDHKTEETTQKELSESFGYFVWDKTKVYPMSYEGFLKWATENVYREDKALQKWVPFIPIEMQRDFYKKVWELKADGTLKHRFIRICRPRGDMKSFDAILLFLFRFFNMPREKILLTANSKDQSDYALYDEARDIILNSPSLNDTPGLEIKEKEIVLMCSKTERFSRIKSIASKQGAMSNSTCVVFSEIYKQTDHNFVVELEGSIRTVPNAMSIIESTVSREGTYYHRQYEASLTGKSPAMYFQYYSDHHYNPNMTDEELAQYKESFFPEEYRMFFRNRWGDAGEGLFSDITIMQMGIAGFDGIYGPSERLSAAMKEYLRARRKRDQLNGAGDITPYIRTMQDIEKRIISMDSVYSLPASTEDLEKIKELFKCSDLFIGVGLDRAEQLTSDADRSALVTNAKAFVNGEVWYSFLLDIYMPAESLLTLFENRIIENNDKYGYLARIDVEKAQGKDLTDWCELNGYETCFAPASYEYQKEIFRLMYMKALGGYLKCPTVPIWTDGEGQIIHSMPPTGIKDIIRSEAAAFEHMVRTGSLGGRPSGWFGSKFKKANKHGRPKKGEARDDSMYGWAHGITASNFGDTPYDAANEKYPGAIPNKDVVGDWARR